MVITGFRASNVYVFCKHFSRSFLIFLLGKESAIFGALYPPWSSEAKISNRPNAVSFPALWHSNAFRIMLSLLRSTTRQWSAYTPEKGHERSSLVVSDLLANDSTQFQSPTSYWLIPSASQSGSENLRQLWPGHRTFWDLRWSEMVYVCLCRFRSLCDRSKLWRVLPCPALPVVLHLLSVAEFFCSTRALLFPPQALENPPAEDRGEMIGEMCSSMALAFACRSYLSESDTIKQIMQSHVISWSDMIVGSILCPKSIHYSHALVFCHGVGSHSNPGWTTPVLAKSLKTKASPIRTKNMSWVLTFLPKPYSTGFECGFLSHIFQFIPACACEAGNETSWGVTSLMERYG